ncbi:MAG: hypothetical protein LBT38_03765 [Deltaproteobacteria bacterium]|jgi:hypothetical protein|nr:hypothetical protein [Deltaproteobacteria bacterium]
MRAQYPILKPQRQGMILVTTLILVMILTVAGGTLLFKSRSELSTTTNFRNHQKALANADTVMKVAMKAMDVMASNSSIEAVKSFFEHSGQYKYKFKFSPQFAKIFEGVRQTDRISVKARYLGAGSSTGGNEPDIVITDLQDRIVGLARISFDFIDRTVEYGGKLKSGDSIGLSGMGTGADSITSFYVITVVGRDPDSKGGDIFAEDALESAGPQAFLTALYCVGTSCAKS